jgi:uncharacterized membrane protein
MASDSIDLGRSRQIALWFAIGCILLVGVGFSWNPTPFAELLAAIFVACAFLHAVASYGLRIRLVFFIVCVAITFAIENIGTATGFPFGHYHFEVGADLPHIGRIPIVVGPLWFGAGYFSFVVAATLLDGADRRLDQRFNLVALPIVAAFVVTQWDLVIDPPNATIARAWIWHDGGAIFGVPLSNFLGWLLTSWLFFQAFALVPRQRRTADPRPVPNRQLRLIAILFYLGAGLPHLVPYLFPSVMGQTGEVVDAAGRLWRIQDIREATVGVFIFTMLFTALLAALRLLSPGNERTAASARRDHRHDP